MAVLDQATRDKLPSSDFVFPDTREYPIHDETHARAALDDVGRVGTPEQKQAVHDAVAKRYPNIQISGGSTTGLNQASKAPDRQGQDPSMRQIFRPAKRVGLDNKQQPAPKQPGAGTRKFKIGKE